MIDEIVGDAMDSMDVRLYIQFLFPMYFINYFSIVFSFPFFLLQPEGIESEVDLEVDKVLEEIAADVLSKAASAPVGVPVAAVAEEASANKVDTMFLSMILYLIFMVQGEEDPEEVIRRMQERLQSL